MIAKISDNIYIVDEKNNITPGSNQKALPGVIFSLYNGVHQSLSSLSTAMKASVGTWTVPRFRIFFLPVGKAALFNRASPADLK